MRHIRMPRHPVLLEELEGLEAEELRRRDRVRFTATGSNHDDLCVALCLAADGFAGPATRPEESRIGRIDRCVAFDMFNGEYHIDCPVANEAGWL